MNYSEMVIQEYEAKTNKTMAFICRIMIGLMVAVGVLNYLHVFKISNSIYPTLLISIAILILPTIFYDLLNMDNVAIRYFVLTANVIMSGILYAFLSYHVIIMLVFPVVVSSLYCDKKSVIYTSVLSVPVMVISHLIAFQLKIVPDEPLVTLHGVLIYGVIPRVLELTAFAVICTNMASKVQQLIRNLGEKNTELYSDQEMLIASLSEMIEAQSQETGQHVKRVAEYTWILCEALDMDEHECWKVSTAAMMHDVGKILIPQEIINKPGKLTTEEYELIKNHAKYGKKLLVNSPGELMQISAEIAYQHHERYDGKGYYGIAGEDISLYARCVAIADVFDALVSRRPYKAAWTPREARDEIIRNAGTQFDPRLVMLFEKYFDRFVEVLKKYPDEAQHAASCGDSGEVAG